MFVMRREQKNQLDTTEWFIALVISSTCFGNFSAHHQELETICAALHLTPDNQQLNTVHHRR